VEDEKEATEEGRAMRLWLTRGFGLVVEREEDGR
jgi:hypothetical protein